MTVKKRYLSLLPAVLVLASPTRPLTLTLTRSHRPSFVSDGLLSQSNKLRHVVHSDNFSEIIAPSRNRWGKIKRGLIGLTLGGLRMRALPKWLLLNSRLNNNGRLRLRFSKSPNFMMDTSQNIIDATWYTHVMTAQSTLGAVTVRADEVTRWNLWKRFRRIDLATFSKSMQSQSLYGKVSSLGSLGRQIKVQSYASLQSSTRGGAAATKHTTATSSSTTMAILNSSPSSSSSVLSTHSTSSMTSSIESKSSKFETWTIQTPFFPIILPKSWEPPSADITSATFIEISVASEVDDQPQTSKPSMEHLRTATMPLIPKAAWADMTGNEFYHPETMHMLTQTGIKLALDGYENIDWVGDKKTEKFLQDLDSARDDRELVSLAQELSSSQEILVWSGQFNSNLEHYGAKIPVIKTKSVIDKSPRYLAELLMDSSRVKIYNKMSIGRTDEVVFQEGVDTVDGSFGDGESKVVRNLTKPPMMNNILEFITCMHARKLTPDDSPSILTSDNTHPMEGYIVVSRAVTGGKWNPTTANSSGEKYVRNEILLGVNLLKGIPGEPNKTELTAVTHVYSPMIPLMLAKNVGVKGAVDFLRDIRAIS